MKGPDLITDEEHSKMHVSEAFRWYGQYFFCHNCGKSNHRYIRKGRKKPDWVICDNCECATRP